MHEPPNAHADPVGAANESEELLRLAIQVGGVGIYDTDLERGRTRFSAQLCAILGLPIGTEMTYREASQLFDARDRAALNASLDEAGAAIDTGKWNGVHRIVRVDGAVRWVSIQGRRYYHHSENGRRAVRSIGTVVDITHLKETGAALRESELRLRLALEAAEMGTFEADIAGGQAIIDAQEARLLGLPLGTRFVSAKELRAHVRLEDLQGKDAQKERRGHNGTYHHEFSLSMPDGTHRWLSAYAAIRSNRIFGVNFDVTARKRAEAALRESEERLQIATRGAALGIFERDVRTDRTVWVNERMYEILGRTRADGSLTRREFLENYLHPDDTGIFHEALQRSIRNGGNFHAVSRIRRKDGLVLWLQIDGKFEFADTGEPLRFFGVVADVTARKMLEREAADLSERLITLQEDERQRISLELHDSTAQHLVAANLNLMNLRSKVGLGNDELKLWDEVETSMAKALMELRTFSYLMYPLNLDADGLRTTVSRYIDGYARRSGLVVKFRSSEIVDTLPFHMQRSLFRIIQEALANVHRHARASRVSVDLRWIAGRLHVIIADNGRGGNNQDGPPFRSGVGIFGMRARARQFGGDLRIRNAPHGTRVHVVAVIHPACHREASNELPGSHHRADC
jgi:PAS domain S-box-containing protein